MEKTVEKLASLERDVSGEKGDFSLFALLLREDALGKWDLLASAPWMQIDKKEALKYLVEKIGSYLDPDEFLVLSRVVPIEEGNPGLKAIHDAFRTRHGRIEVQESILFGLPIKRAIIITSEKKSPASDKGKEAGTSAFFKELVANSVDLRANYER